MINRILLLFSFVLALLGPAMGQELHSKGLSLGEIRIDQAATEVEKAIGLPDLK